MKTETLNQLTEILAPLGYNVITDLPDRPLYLIPNHQDHVQIAFYDGLFVLKFSDDYFLDTEADAIIRDIQKMKKIVAQLNEICHVTGFKAEAILQWQKKINDIGISLNLNGAEKFWNFVKSYGLDTHRSGSPEFDELLIWNQERVVLRLYLNKETQDIQFEYGLYNEDGDYVKDLAPETLEEALAIEEMTKHSIRFKLDEHLHLHIWTGKVGSSHLYYEFY